MNIKSICMTGALALGLFSVASSQENIATKLGYPADAKLLIIHADDLGLSHSENLASFEAIENGSVNSASVMMPAAWALEAVNYAKANPESHDVGIHLVLTSEWEHYKWGPASPKDKVPSLVDELGYFHAGCKTDLNLSEVETELKAQIDWAYALGLEPTHLDVHMGCLFNTDGLAEIYFKLGQLYSLPILALNHLPSQEIKDKYDVKIVVDYFYNLTPEAYSAGAEAYYVDVLKNMQPGLSYISIHAAYDNAEMKGMTMNQANWGSEWRQKDFDFFTSDVCQELLKEENIKLLTWRQLKEVFY